MNQYILRTDASLDEIEEALENQLNSPCFIYFATGSHNPHRVVKVDYSVLKSFLDVLVNNEAVANWDGFDYDWNVTPISKELKEKASNIINNS